MVSVRHSFTTIACGIALLASLPLAHAQSTTAAPAIDKDAAAVDQLVTDKADPQAAHDLVSKSLDSESDAVRWRAARAAGHLGLDSPEILAKLQQGVADDDWIMQLHSIAALAKTGDKSDATIAALLKAVGSENHRVASAAVSALGELKVEPQQLATVLDSELAEDNNGAVAVHAVKAIVEAGAKAVPLLNELLDQPNSGYWACVAIAEIGPDAADVVPQLMQFINTNKYAEEIPQALMAVAAIGPQAKSAEKAVTGAMEKWSDDQSVQLAGLYALGAIGATDARETLEVSAASDDAFTAMVASWSLAKTSPGDAALMKAAIRQLVAGLKSDNANMSRAAAHGLATLDIPEGMAAPILIAAAKDPKAREHMVTALAGLGDKALPHASKALAKPDTRDLALDVLDHMGAKAAGATDALVGAMKEADAATKVKINHVLGRIGPAAAKATDNLVAELKSDNKEVRQSALYALREVGAGAEAVKAALMGHLKSKSDAKTPEEKFERLAAAWTLARLANKDQEVVAVVVPVLSEGLDSNSGVDRLESITAVVDLGDAGKSLHEKVAKLAKSDPDAGVRNLAIIVASENSGE